MKAALLPVNHPQDFTTRELYVEMCHNGNLCGEFSTRVMPCVFFPGLWTGMNVAVSYLVDPSDLGPFKMFSWGGIASSILQIATGVWCQHNHRLCQEIPKDRFKPINYCNMAMGAVCLAGNISLLVFQSVALEESAS
jgi:hypothetical protein